MLRTVINIPGLIMVKRGQATQDLKLTCRHGLMAKPHCRPVQNGRYFILTTRPYFFCSSVPFRRDVDFVLNLG